MEKIVQKKPMYAQLRDILADRITSKKMPPGAGLPSERELCVEFNVSKHTVIRALTDLVAKGLVHREQGKGTFVSGFTPKLGTIRFVFYRTTQELPLDNYYASVLGAVESIVSMNGYDLVVSSTQSDASFLAGPDDTGYLLVGPVSDDLATRTMAKGVPVVCIDHMECLQGAGVVAFDEIASGELAANVLLSRGFRRIGYIGGYDSLSPNKREWPNSTLRCEGVRKGLAKAGLSISEKDIVRVCRASEYVPFIEKALSEGGLPDAFVTFSDSNAEGFVNALEKLGRSITMDRLVSFSPLNFNAVLRGMTRIAGDPGLLGTEGAKMLTRAIKEPGRKLGTILLERRAVQEMPVEVQDMKVPANQGR